MYTDYLRNLDHEGVAFDVPIGMSRHCRPGSGPVTDVFLSYHRPTGDTQPRTSSICWSDPGRGEREVGRRAFMATPWRPRHRFWVPSAATTTARKARKAVTAAGACRPATTGRGADDELSELDPLVCLLGGNTLVVVPAELVLQPSWSSSRTHVGSTPSLSSADLDSWSVMSSPVGPRGFIWYTVTHITIHAG
jgi:hypothetical protein